MNYNGGKVNYIADGPWGGQSGARWDDGVYSAVRQVVITISPAGINSIQFEYDKNGSSIWSERHGGTSGIKIDQIKLLHPTEYLVSISGHYSSITVGGPVIVRSLSFQSNRRKYGPFGIEQGTPFSLPVLSGMLVGFHGRSSWYLDSIGVYIKPLPQKISTIQDHNVPRSNKQVMSYGPWGGLSGTIFDDGIYTGVREVHITRSGALVSIRVCYDQNGTAVWGYKNGGSGGLKLEKIVFDYPYEVLTQITGYYESTILRGPTTIKSITFHTTKRSYGPFGEQRGFSFSSGSTGAIVGFHGRKGYFVNSIGVHILESKTFLHKPDPYPFNMRGMNEPEVVWGVPREPTAYEEAYEEGPWGGEAGKRWDDGVYTGVKKILLTRGHAICSIQVKYDRNGQSVWSARHGVANDSCRYQIELDYPYEVLTCISGYYDDAVGERQRRVIRSLTFHTKRSKYEPYGKESGTYGPYGKESGTYFSSANTEGKVVGFHGRSGCFLDAIGVHMQY